MVSERHEPNPTSEAPEDSAAALRASSHDGAPGDIRGLKAVGDAMAPDVRPDDPSDADIASAGSPAGGA